MTPDPKAPWRSRFAALHPKAYLGIHGVGGIVLIALLLWAFGYIADEIPEKGVLVTLDTGITSWLQTHGTETGEAIFSYVSWLGAPVLTAVLVTALIVCARRRDWTRASTIALCGGGAALLNIALKALFHRGRPEYATEFITHTSWSFPSGHAMDSLAGYGIITFFLLEARRLSRPRRTIIIVATSLLVAIIGYSRVYLGVHYFSDVIAGFLAGGVWLFVCVEGYRFAVRRLPHASTAG
ncbi:MAG: phosphoesterase PA-phosphatase related protein [Gemmatimonadetes bacterium]|nr:phosphoesterase PA-phosphatase related protein [Gemmatimonadota bacterium]